MRLLSISLLLSTVIASTASASEGGGQPALEISLKAGGHFPQITGKLGTNFDAVLKVGYGVALDHRLQLFVDLGYSQPTHTAQASDPRLGTAGAAYSSTLTVRDLSTTVGAAYFLLPPGAFLVPYAGAGLRLHFLKSDVVGTGASAAFGENTETSTQVGGAVFGGAGLHLGPGLLLGELRFGYAPVGQKVTGQANVGALSVLLGYGLLL
jgi:hypothetical protein